MNSDFIKDIMPPILIRKLRGVRYGWHGKYKTWEAARAHSAGYDSEKILNKVKESTLKVKNGEAVYERDSVLFDEIQYSFPVLASLMWIAAQNSGELNIADFGGSLGSTYFQNKRFFEKLEKVNWCVVEQPSFVDAGKALFESDQLQFFNTIGECTGKYRIDAVLFSSVLQYLENPFEILDEVYSLNVKYIIIDRTPFIPGKDRITVQKVPPAIYEASYPCWFFNKAAFVEKIKCYNMVLEFDAIDEANIDSEFKGFLYERKNFHS